MGGQTGSQEQQTQQVTQLPPWINDAAQQNYAFAQNVASRPLQQYQGAMTPDVSQQLQQSWNTAATGGNAGLPQLNAATAGYAGALGQTPMSVSAGGPTQQIGSTGTTSQVSAGGPTMQVGTGNAQQIGPLGSTSQVGTGNAQQIGPLGSTMQVGTGNAQQIGPLGSTMQVNAGGPTSAVTAGAGNTMGVYDPGNASMIRAGQLSNTNLSPYMDPYTNDVINSSLATMQQNLGLSQIGQQNAASGANAFGGSRMGVQQGVTQAQGALGMGQMAAGLNQANFQQAQAVAQQDIGTRLTAATTNQAAQQANANRNLQAQGMNQSANATDLARQAQIGQANQTAQANDIQRNLTAQGMNQSANAADLSRNLQLAQSNQAVSTSDLARGLQAQGMNQSANATDLSRNLQLAQSNQAANTSDLARGLTAQQSNQAANAADLSRNLQLAQSNQTTNTSDLARGLQAQQSNQAANATDLARGLTAGTTNAQNQAADYSRALQAAQSNQAANAADLTRSLTAQQSNQGAQQAKINSDINAASGLNQTGQTAGQLAQNAFGMQNTAGLQQMAQSQNDINAQMSKFGQAWQYPTQQLGALQSALGMTPYGQATTGQSDTQTQTSTDWGALAASGMGMLGNIFAGKLGPTSDKRLKKNLQKLGVHAPSKTPIYAYNWKGEPPGSPKSLGPMAQDLRKTIPGSVAKHPTTGILHVHPGVLGALARPAPAGTLGAMAVGKPVHQSLTQHRRRVRPPQIRGALSV